MTITARCRHCGSLRELSDLLEVVEIRTGLITFACRPDTFEGSRCFRYSVRGSDVEGIRVPQEVAA